MFNSVTRNYYRGAVAVIYVFSTIDRDSFLAIPKWHSLIMAECGASAIVPVLVQNMMDKVEQSATPPAEVEALARQMGAKLYRTALTSPSPLPDIFEYVATAYIHRSSSATNNNHCNAGANSTKNNKALTNQSFNHSGDSFGGHNSSGDHGPGGLAVKVSAVPSMSAIPGALENTTVGLLPSTPARARPAPSPRGTGTGNGGGRAAFTSASKGDGAGFDRSIDVPGYSEGFVTGGAAGRGGARVLEHEFDQEAADAHGDNGNAGTGANTTANADQLQQQQPGKDSKESGKEGKKKGKCVVM